MKKVFQKIWGIIKALVVVLMIFITVSLFVMKLMGDTPTIFGFNFYYIVTESMEPDLEVGDVILSKEVSDYSSLEVGDVVTYKGEVGSYANKLITHQIIEIKDDDPNNIIFVTKGTNPKSPIDPEISQDQIVSKMIFEVPLLGKLMQLINKPIGFILLIVLPLSIFLFIEIKNFIFTLKSKDDDEEENEIVKES